jgi:hypothetical protein
VRSDLLIDELAERLPEQAMIGRVQRALEGHHSVHITAAPGPRQHRLSPLVRAAAACIVRPMRRLSLLLSLLTFAACGGDDVAVISPDAAIDAAAAIRRPRCRPSGGRSRWCRPARSPSPPPAA